MFQEVTTLYCRLYIPADVERKRIIDEISDFKKGFMILNAIWQYKLNALFKVMGEYQVPGEFFFACRHSSNCQFRFVNT